MSSPVNPRSPFKDDLSKYLNNSLSESQIHDNLDDATVALSRAKRHNYEMDIEGTENDINEAEVYIRRARNLTESSSVGGRSYVRDEWDIENVPVIALNFPKTGSKTQFKSVKSAAIKLRDLGLTQGQTLEGDRGICENIFASIMGTEDRTDRIGADNRYTAYKNEEGEKIKWSVVDYKNLSYDNIDDYCRTHGIKEEVSDETLDLVGDCVAYENILKKYASTFKRHKIPGDHYIYPLRNGELKEKIYIPKSEHILTYLYEIKYDLFTRYQEEPLYAPADIQPSEYSPKTKNYIQILRAIDYAEGIKKLHLLPYNIAVKRGFESINLF